MMNKTYTHEEMLKIMEVVCGIASADALMQVIKDDAKIDEIANKAMENTVKNAETWIKIALN